MCCTVWTHYLKHTYVPIWTFVQHRHHTNKEGSKGQACWLNNKDKTHNICQWNVGGRGHRTFNTVHSQNGQRIYISYVGQWNLTSVGPQTTYEWKTVINSLYCSDRQKPNYGEYRNIRTQEVTIPSKSSMNFKDIRFTFCIGLLHRKITNENVLDILLNVMQMK